MRFIAGIEKARPFSGDEGGLVAWGAFDFAFVLTVVDVVVVLLLLLLLLLLVFVVVDTVEFPAMSVPEIFFVNLGDPVVAFAPVATLEGDVAGCVIVIFEVLCGFNEWVV
jgi:hypothetical protein